MSTAVNLFTQNVAEIKLSYVNTVKPSLRPTIVSSKDAADIFRTWYQEGNIGLREEFWVMYLNRANRVLGILQVSIGGVAGTVVDAKFVLSGLIKLNACGAILCHNHPSGNLKPSQPDLDLTKKISTACKLLDCSMLDHIILSP